MTSHMLRFSRISIGRLVLVVGTGALLAAAVVIGRDYRALHQRAGEREVEVGAVYRAIPDLAAVTRESDVVAVGRVVAQGATRVLRQPDQSPAPVASPTPGRRGAAGSGGPVEEPSAGKNPGADYDTPVTDYTVVVDRVLQGRVAAGSRLTVTQPGGRLELPTFRGGPKLKRTFVFEEDPLMAVGEEHVFFLKQAPDGSYYVVGGPQGRFQVRDGRAEPVAPGSPLGRAHPGEPLEDFLARVRAVAR